jgi:hypothetical protein
MGKIERKKVWKVMKSEEVLGRPIHKLPITILENKVKA